MAEQAATDTSGVASREYKVHRSVFEDAQRKWGDCTIDAFATAATALLPRYWTADKTAGAEGTDAFAQEWRAGEVNWCHPPPELQYLGVAQASLRRSHDDWKEACAAAVARLQRQLHERRRPLHRRRQLPGGQRRRGGGRGGRR